MKNSKRFKKIKKHTLIMAIKKTTKVEEFYDRIAAGYDKIYQNPYWKLYNEITWHNIKQFLPKKETLSF